MVLMEGMGTYGEPETVRAYLPPQWPEQVPHPEAEQFEARVVAWLLDIGPPEFRRHPVLWHHPVALVRLVHRHVVAQGSGVDLALAGVRAELAGHLDAAAIESVCEALLEQRRALLARRNAVRVVEHVLRGGSLVEPL